MTLNVEWFPCSQIKKSLKQLTHHLNRFRIHGFGDDAIVIVDVFDHLLKGTSFDFLPLQVVQRLGEVEQHAALPDLLDQELFALGGVGF
jgi:hypothetical protein